MRENELVWTKFKMSPIMNGHLDHISDRGGKLHSKNVQIPNWKVMLIGGSAGVGKTTVASMIACHFNVSFGQVDDFRMALQNVTSPAKYPQLHFFISSPGVAKEGIWEKTPEELCDALVNVGKVVSKALEIVIAHHVATGIPIVLEGDGILPELAVQSNFAGLDVQGQVSSVLIHEPDESFFFTRIQGYGSKTDSEPLREQWTQARMNWLYGQWLTKEAERLQLPVVPARPWDTLTDRVLGAVR